MPDTSNNRPANSSENNHIVINWRDKRITRLITLQVTPESVTNSSHSFNTIVNSILISITILGYDDSLIQFNIPLDPTTNYDEVNFQHLSQNDTCRGGEQTFNEVVMNIRNR